MTAMELNNRRPTFRSEVKEKCKKHIGIVVNKSKVTNTSLSCSGKKLRFPVMTDDTRKKKSPSTTSTRSASDCATERRRLKDETGCVFMCQQSKQLPQTWVRCSECDCRMHKYCLEQWTLDCLLQATSVCCPKCLAVPTNFECVDTKTRACVSFVDVLTRACRKLQQKNKELVSRRFQQNRISSGSRADALQNRIAYYRRENKRRKITAGGAMEAVVLKWKTD